MMYLAECAARARLDTRVAGLNGVGVRPSGLLEHEALELPQERFVER